MISRSARYASKLSLAAATAALVALVSACAAPEPRQEASLYERLGGKAAIYAMIDDAIVNISTDRRINHRFADANGPQLKQNLFDLVCERTGGPCVYRGKNMADAHEGMQVRPEEFDALVEDMGKAMDRAKVGPREKAESMAILAKMKNAIVGH